MDKAAIKADLISQYRAYRDIIVQKGLFYTPLDDETLEKMENADLSISVRHARNIASTPFKGSPGGRNCR